MTSPNPSTNLFMSFCFPHLQARSYDLKNLTEAWNCVQVDRFLFSSNFIQENYTPTLHRVQNSLHQQLRRHVTHAWSNQFGIFIRPWSRYINALRCVHEAQVTNPKMDYPVIGLSVFKPRSPHSVSPKNRSSQ